MNLVTTVNSLWNTKCSALGLSMMSVLLSLFSTSKLTTKCTFLKTIQSVVMEMHLGGQFCPYNVSLPGTSSCFICGADSS
jgi:hypothetical protein